MSHFCYKSVISGILFLSSSPLFAQMIAWNQQIPSSLKPFQGNAQALANLSQDQIFIYAHPYTKTTLPTQKNNQNP